MVIAFNGAKSRFARASDLFVSKYLRMLTLEIDPGYLN